MSLALALALQLNVLVISIYKRIEQNIGSVRPALIGPERLGGFVLGKNHQVGFLDAFALERFQAEAYQPCGDA